MDGNMHQLVQDAFGNTNNDPPVNEYDVQNSLNSGPDHETKAFYNLLRDAHDPLWEGCELTRLSFLVLLFHIKSVNKWSNKSLNDLLAILQQAIPNGKNLPGTFAEAKRIIGKLGLNYVKIHVCPNNCQLYRKAKANDDFCSKCGTSRWKNKEDKTTLTKKERRRATPRKVLRYFPIKPRLKRLFMHKETAIALRWHDEGRTKDGVLRHPADSEAWKSIDSRNPQFASDSRNIRFAMASDGFNPFGILSSTYSCWPVVLIPYNLPPWLCMKASSIMLALIIPGPSYARKDFHVFKEPVYEELFDLFEVGTPTYDASRNEMFQLRATVLFTISDYPGIGIFAGYSVNGEFACITYREETCSKRLKHGHKYCFMGHRRFLPLDHELRYNENSFDGTEEHRVEPLAYSETSVLQKIEKINDFEKSKTWKCRSGLFSLPYWDLNVLHHNLDVMHIEKNVCDNIYGTLLGVEGKSKDNLQARLDLQEMNIRPDLHPIRKANNKYCLPPASYTMSKREKQQFCKVLHDIKVPDGYAGNISKCINVSQGKISGLKSHDCHILMQELLPVALRGVLPDNVTSVLFDLCGYFRELSSKVLYIDVLDKYLSVLKSYVRNKAHPEGCIAEAYLADECMTFCSRYLEGFETKHNQPTRNDDNDESVACSDDECTPYLFPHVGKPLGKPRSYVIRGLTKMQAHRYVLFNCPDVDPYLRTHADEIRRTYRQGHITPKIIERIQNEKFHEWFRAHIMDLERKNGICSVKNDHRWLARGPIGPTKRYRAFNTRGFRFRPKHLDGVTQNSGVVLSAKTSSYTKSSDTNPILGDLTYYGRVIDIIELNYSGQFSVVLFKCEWVDVVSRKGVKKDKYGYTLVNFSHLIHTGEKVEHEPFIFPNQADQVYYVDDPMNPGWSVVRKNKPRDIYDIGEDEWAGDIEIEPFHVSHLGGMSSNANNYKQWVRTDVEGTTVDVDNNALNNEG
ncbi:uncharacterized protein LOC127776976 [Oryza glaberrima]|uniref:uncharacterized protein LOC127776976 n=1 Tax=Oryza glaberrima TaxID=4538 RepID=UPI00224C55B7|nr:uncharacterized protein LOC127776976 [Oryza glaberrima]